MKKIAALKIEYTYANTPDSEARANRFYNWLISKAIDNLLKKQKGIDNNSTQKYTKSNEENAPEEAVAITGSKASQVRPSIIGRSTQIQRTPRRGVSDPRGSSKDAESQKDHHLQDVQNGQASSSEVWQGLENKQQEVNGSFGGEV